MSGSGGAKMEVCLSNGVSAGQVGQVGQLAGTAERGLPGASCWTNNMIACRKQVFLLHY